MEVEIPSNKCQKQSLENDIAMAKTQANSLKELEKPILSDKSISREVDDPTERVNDFEMKNKPMDDPLIQLMNDYFHKPLVTHLRSGMGPSHSPFVYLLDAMHKTQRHIKSAIQSNHEVSVIVPKPIYLTSEKPVLIIDLDETLIHSSSNHQAGEHVFTIKTRAQGLVSFSVVVRPFAREFLQAVKQYYTLILFTASDKAYASKVLHLIDPNDDIFALKLYKHSCLTIDNKFSIKDLRMFRNIHLDDIIILDNNPVCYLLQPGNAIPITSFYFDLEDIELKKLSTILAYIAPIKNKQAALKNYFYKDFISNLIKFDDVVSSILNNSNHI